MMMISFQDHWSTPTQIFLSIINTSSPHTLARGVEPSTTSGDRYNVLFLVYPGTQVRIDTHPRRSLIIYPSLRPNHHVWEATITR